NYTSYLRPTDGSPAIRLGEGGAAALSGDGKYALSRLLGSPSKLFLLPVQGAPKQLNIGAIDPYSYHSLFVPHSHKIVFDGREPGHGTRLYLLDPESDALPKAVTPEGTRAAAAITSDGNFLVARNQKNEYYFYPIAGGAPRPVSG